MCQQTMPALDDDFNFSLPIFVFWQIIGKPIWAQPCPGYVLSTIMSGYELTDEKFFSR